MQLALHSSACRIQLATYNTIYYDVRQLVEAQGTYAANLQYV